VRPGGILIVRFSSMGDVVMATAAARWLRERASERPLYFATKPAFAPLLQGQPDLDEVWTLGPEGLGGLLSRARAAGVGGLLDLHGNLRSRALGLRWGGTLARWRAEGLNRRLHVHAKWLKPRQAPPVLERYCEAAAGLLGEAPPERAPLPRLAVAPEAEAWAGEWLKAQGWREGEPLLAIAPGAAWPTKRWSAAQLAAAVGGACAGGARPLLLGAPSEQALAEAVRDALGPALRGRALIACREAADIRRLPALIARSRAFLGHDSGPMHVAEALGVPVSAVFGPTARAFGFYPQGPRDRVFERDLPCRPCHLHGGQRCPLGHHACLAGLEPAPVAAHLAAILKGEA
jgi:heptosyltransferase-2